MGGCQISKIPCIPSRQIATLKMIEDVLQVRIKTANFIKILNISINWTNIFHQFERCEKSGWIFFLAQFYIEKRIAHTCLLYRLYSRECLHALRRLEHVKRM